MSWADTRTNRMVAPIPPKEEARSCATGLLLRITQASLAGISTVRGAEGKNRANTLRVERLFSDVVPALKELVGRA